MRRKNSFLIGIPVFVIALFIVLFMISNPSLLPIQEVKYVKFKGASVEIFEMIEANPITIPREI